MSCWRNRRWRFRNRSRRCGGSHVSSSGSTRLEALSARSSPGVGRAPHPAGPPAPCKRGRRGKSSRRPHGSRRGTCDVVTGIHASHHIPSPCHRGPSESLELPSEFSNSRVARVATAEPKRCRLRRELRVKHMSNERPRTGPFRDITADPPNRRIPCIHGHSAASARTSRTPQIGLIKPKVAGSNPRPLPHGDAADDVASNASTRRGSRINGR